MRLSLSFIDKYSEDQIVFGTFFVVISNLCSFLIEILFINNLFIWLSALKVNEGNLWCKVLLITLNCKTKYFVCYPGKWCSWLNPVCWFWIGAQNCPSLGSIPGRIIPKTFKMALDTSLLNTQQYKVHIKSKVDQSRERSSTLPYTSV